MSFNHTLFGQLLQEISRYDFEKFVEETKSEMFCKGFKSWDHFVALLYSQLSKKDNLRGIETGMSLESNKLYHLGVSPIKRSTLSYANNHRPNELFYKIFSLMLDKIMKHTPGHKFKFKNPLYSIDSTTIDLCLSMHDWATFRKTKGGIKLHFKLDHRGYIPDFCIMSEAIKHDKQFLKRFPLKSGDIAVFDRGYNDYKQFASLCKNNIYFVTRLKKNAQYSVIKKCEVPKNKNIISDKIVQFTGFYSTKKCPIPLRLIESLDPETEKTIIILTNQLKLSADTISRIYRDRWQIEIFFKTLKQNLKIKSFIGTSKNAILSQVWTALIAYLLMCYLKFKSIHKWTVRRLLEALQGSLFARKNLWDWLNHPFDNIKNKNGPPVNNQMELIF